MKVSLSFRTTLALLVPLLLMAAWVGMRGLNADSFWLDEIWSVRYAHAANPFDVWSRIAAQDPWQAPGYYMLLNLWGATAGWSEFTVRFLSLLAGLLGIAFTYRLARDLTSRPGALAAAVALGASAYYLYFFHEARAYTFYVLLTPMMVWAYRRFALSGRWWFAMLLIVALTGALYIHYFAALTALLLGVFHLTLGLRWLRNSRRWWLLTGIFALCVLLFLPWLSVMLRGVAQAESELAVRGANALTSEAMIRGALFLFSNGSTAFMVFALVFAVRRGRRIVLAWAWCLGLAGLLLAINAFLGVVLEIRYMLAVWPVLALLVGFGLENLGRSRSSIYVAFLSIWIAACLWMSFSPEAAVALRNPQWFLPWREWHAALEVRTNTSDAVVVALPDWTWAVYQEEGRDYYLRDLAADVWLVAQPDNVPGGDYPAQMHLGDDTQRVWLVFDPTQPTSHMELARETLERDGFVACSVVPAQPENIQLFARVPDQEQAATAVFGAPASIHAYRVGGDPGGDVTLIWSYAEGVDPLPLSAGVYLEDASGRIVSQADAGLPTSSSGCVDYDLPPAEAAVPGSLSQSVAVYSWATGERIPAVDAQVAVLDDGRAVIDVITVDPWQASP